MKHTKISFSSIIETKIGRRKHFFSPLQQSEDDKGIDTGVDDLDDEQPEEPQQTLLEKLLQQRAAMFVRDFLRRVRAEKGGKVMEVVDGLNNGDSEHLWVSGWGSTDEYGATEYLSDVLRKVAVKLQDHSVCLNAYGNDSYSPERNLCAVDNGKGTFFG